MQKGAIKRLGGQEKVFRKKILPNGWRFFHENRGKPIGRRLSYVRHRLRPLHTVLEKKEEMPHPHKKLLLGQWGLWNSCYMGLENVAKYSVNG
ncbi:hypothetical protein [Sphingobacterium hotanense]|uniref:hypothetical protein n=1 Tax=Sphingobacterium hotanense TaxID=649196 RepID=UPI0021A61E01|nr:hypothetical protein [Sphingobacterium hotanense]MCT1526088.1 hypothetical protein [Sphingobacterium hotanense]